MRVPVAICFLMFSAPLAALSFYTGADWREWTTGERLMYLVGYVDGRSNGFFDTLRVMDEKRWREVIREGVAKDPRLKDLDSNVTVGQLFEGVNKLFEDYRNLHVLVRTAVSIIGQEAAGKIILTEEYLQAIRRISAQERK
ncbi:MAG: hypothetical protein ACREXW_16870 [Gammaproteobacteria bacterium]